MQWLINLCVLLFLYVFIFVSLMQAVLIFFYNDVKKVLFFFFMIYVAITRGSCSLQHLLCAFLLDVHFFVCNMKNGQIMDGRETYEVKSKLNIDRCESSYVDSLGIANFLV